MRHLTQRMHARIGAARAGDGDRFAGEFEDRRFQRALHRRAIVLPLPARKRPAVIFERQAIAHVRRDRSLLPECFVVRLVQRPALQRYQAIAHLRPAFEHRVFHMEKPSSNSSMVTLPVAMDSDEEQIDREVVAHSGIDSRDVLPSDGLSNCGLGEDKSFPRQIDRARFFAAGLQGIAEPPQKGRPLVCVSAHSRSPSVQREAAQEFGAPMAARPARCTRVRLTAPSPQATVKPSSRISPGAPSTLRRDTIKNLQPFASRFAPGAGLRAKARESDSRVRAPASSSRYALRPWRSSSHKSRRLRPVRVR